MSPVLRVPATGFALRPRLRHAGTRAALRVFCHPERSDRRFRPCRKGSAFCFTPCIGSASIWPIATDNCLPRVDRRFRAHNAASRPRSQSATGCFFASALFRFVMQPKQTRFLLLATRRFLWPKRGAILGHLLGHCKFLRTPTLCSAAH